MDVKIQWPGEADPWDKILLDSRKRFEDIFHKAFAQRPTDWTVRVVEERSSGIMVLFFDPNGNPYGPPIWFSGMVGAEDVESLTAFLPVVANKT